MRPNGVITSDDEVSDRTARTANLAEETNPLANFSSFVLSISKKLFQFISRIAFRSASSVFFQSAFQSAIQSAIQAVLCFNFQSGIHFSLHLSLFRFPFTKKVFRLLFSS